MIELDGLRLTLGRVGGGARDQGIGRADMAKTGGAGQTTEWWDDPGLARERLRWHVQIITETRSEMAVATGVPTTWLTWTCSAPERSSFAMPTCSALSPSFPARSRQA